MHPHENTYLHEALSAWPGARTERINLKGYLASIPVVKMRLPSPGYPMRITIILVVELVCFSQAPPIPPTIDSLSGGAGWFGAGLLGLVLGWLLLVHLPSKDKQLK